jgi:hypothetical protein
MGFRSYVKQAPQGDPVTWTERELEAIERSLAAIPVTLFAEDVSATTYTLVAGDKDKVKCTTSGSATTITIPADKFELGAMVYFEQHGAGQVTLQGDGTATVNSRPGLKSAGQYAMFFIWHKENNAWIAGGDLTT